ncbi:MAG TPA: ABC transporter permease [Cyclobacteriaceae bacterium]|nr:ABC transporter permease [Cyclobacteriaceae bacterium]
MNDMKPPRWIDSLLDNLAPPHLAEEIKGDLNELFVKEIEETGARTARWRYGWRGIGFITKRFFWKRSPLPSQPSTIMLGNYFKMAKRSLLTHKATSFINIIGLVTGMAAALALIVIVRYELSFDTFHSKPGQIYRIVRVSGDDMSEFRPGVAFPVHQALRDEISGLKDIVAVEYSGGAFVDVLDDSDGTEKKFNEESGFGIVEPSFFKVFDFADTGFKWLAGNPETALDEPFNMVLTRSMAKKYFGDEDPINKTIRLQQRFDCKVTGVIEDFPPNTDFPFTVLVAYESIKALAPEGALGDWFSVNDSHQVYLRLPDGMSKEEMEQQIARVHAAHTTEELHSSRHYLLQELSDLHHDARFGNFGGRTISRETILALSAVALFLLLTACINYINLATAQSSLRSKEIGLRKVMGSSRKNVMLQFLTETFVIVLLSAIAALIVADVLLLKFQSLLNVTFMQHIFFDPVVLLYLLIIVCCVTIFSGFYPSLVVSRFSPVMALKNRLVTSRSSIFNMRKVLVVVQFTITQVLVVGTFIVTSQMQYFSNSNMGFVKEGIINARVHTRNLSTLEALRNTLLSQPYVEKVSYSYTLPSGVERNRSYQSIGLPGASEMKDFTVYERVPVDPNFIDLYKIRLLAGRNLTMSDSTGNVLVNKTLLKNLGLGTPEEAIGKELIRGGGLKLVVVGVIDNYYGNSLKEGSDNVVMTIEPAAYAMLNVKLNVKEGESLNRAVEGIEKLWSETFPAYVFQYSFFDENIAAFYAQEKKYAKLFQLFSIVFLLIGCLGLYGLITFMVNSKGKEVAVRKVLGATITSIMMLFSKDYIRLIILSFILAVPIAWYLANHWLSGFANPIELRWWLFALPGIGVLIITMLVVGSKMARTAHMNPVEKLKNE